MRKYYVYELQDPRKQDQPFYVGKGSGRRALKHVEFVRGGRVSENRLKDNVIRQILQENLEPIIYMVKTELEEDDAYKLETELILKYGSYRDGGILTNICKEAKPPSWLGKKKSPEHCAKMSIIMTGAGNPMYGKPPSEETRRKMSDALKGKPSKRKGRTFGPIHTEETKRILSEKRIGEKNPFFGKKHSEGTRQKLSENRRGKKMPPRLEETSLKIRETKLRNAIEKIKTALSIMNETGTPITKKTVAIISGLCDKTVRRYWNLV